MSWHGALRLFGVWLLETEGTEAWDSLEAEVRNAGDAAAGSLLLEAVLVASDPAGLIRRLWPLLVADDGARLVALLDRFLYVGTIPDPRLGEWGLTAQDVAAVEHAHRVPSGHRVVLNQSGRTPSRQAVWTELHALLVRHKLPERSFHALRHYFLTALVRGGANLEAVRELAGHSNLHTTQRYVHATGADLGVRVASGKRKHPSPLSAGLGCCFLLLGRGGQIRTADLTDPNRARYQTALRPEWALRWVRPRWTGRVGAGGRMMGDA